MAILRTFIVACIGCCVFASVARAAEQRKIRVWMNIADRGTDAALRAYERAHSNIRIVTSIYKEGSDSQKLMTAIAGGEPPDIVLQDRFSVGEWAARDAFLQLDSRIAGSSIDPKKFYDACWQEASYQGHVY